MSFLLGVITYYSGDGILFEISWGGGEGVGGFLVCGSYGCVFLQDIQFSNDK